MLDRAGRSTMFAAVSLPPMGPDMLEEAIGLLGAARGAASRADLIAYVRAALPDKIAPASRDRFARYLARPYLIDDVVDNAALTLLDSALPEASRRQIATLQLAASEPIIGAFLDDCLPDPGWRRFTVAGLTNWVTRRRGQSDRTTVYRLMGALRRAGYLRPFDRAWLVVAPPPSAAAILLNALRDIDAPGRTTLGALFATPTIRRTLAPIRAVYALLAWANDAGIVTWAGPGDPGIWLPYDRLTVAEMIADIADDEPSIV